MHSGGISAVAMATPGITVDFCRRVTPMMPAKPPKKAIRTPQIVGAILKLIQAAQAAKTIGRTIGDSPPALNRYASTEATRSAMARTASS